MREMHKNINENFNIYTIRTSKGDINHGKRDYSGKF